MRCPSFMTVVVLSVCLMVSGCRRKEEEPVAVPPDRVDAEVPDTFERIPGAAPHVLVSTEPVTVEEYLDYLLAAGLDIPERFTSDDINIKAPVTGLTRAEAEDLAAWRLCRLADETEWTQARAVIGPVPYPWEDSVPRTDAPLHLIRDWAAGTPAEAAAREKRRSMEQDRLQTLRDTVPALHVHISRELEGIVEQVQQAWRLLKTEIFTTVDNQKDHAEKSILIQRGRQLAEEILSGELGARKLKLRTMKMGEAPDDDRFAEMAAAYQQYLEELRNHVHESTTRIAETNRGLSERIREKKQRIEQAGEGAVTTLANIADMLPAEPPADFHSLQEAATAKAQLGRIRRRARTVATDVMGMYAAFYDDVLPRVAAKAAPDPDELEQVRDEIATREQTLAKWGDAIGQDFEQEPHVFNDLRDLKRVRARREALEHELELLETISDSLQ